MPEKLSEVFGKSVLGSLAQAQAPINVKIEPWMTEFVKGRHSQEEWDWFFWYQTASPFWRFMSEFGSLFASFFGRYSER